MKGGVVIRRGGPAVFSPEFAKTVAQSVPGYKRGDRVVVHHFDSETRLARWVFVFDDSVDFVFISGIGSASAIELRAECDRQWGESRWRDTATIVEDTFIPALERLGLSAVYHAPSASGSGRHR